METHFTIDELLGNSSLTLQQIEMYNMLGLTPTRDKGITISVQVPYPLWCVKDKAKIFNSEAYETIDAHRDLFTFVKMYGYNSLEELKESSYTGLYLWIRIGHVDKHNMLIITHGHGPDRGEAYYRAKDYDDFWDIVKRIKELQINPQMEHEPIMLKQNNQMIGNSYKEWDVII